MQNYKNKKRLARKISKGIHFALGVFMLFWSLGPVAPELFVRQITAAPAEVVTISSGQLVSGNFNNGGLNFTNAFLLTFSGSIVAGIATCDFDSAGPLPTFTCIGTSNVGLGVSTSASVARGIIAVVRANTPGFAITNPAIVPASTMALVFYAPPQGQPGLTNGESTDTFSFQATNFTGNSALAGSGIPVVCGGQGQPVCSAPGTWSGGNPSDGATSQATWPRIEITASQAVATSGNNAANTTNVQLNKCTGATDAITCATPDTSINKCSSVNVMNSSTTVECMFTQELEPNTTYRFRITNVNTSAGPAMPTLTRLFRTGSNASTNYTQPPTGKTTSPASGDTNIALNANITIEFDQAMASSGNGSVTSLSNVRLFSNANLTTNLLTSANELSYNNTTNILTINPASNLSANSGYLVDITSGITASGGVAMSGGRTISFYTGSTADTTAPTVSTRCNGCETSGNIASTSATNMVESTIQFSEDLVNVNNSTVSMFIDNGAGGGTANDYTKQAGETALTSGASFSTMYDTHDRSAHVSYYSNLSTNTRYCMTFAAGASGITDLTGNQLVSAITMCFQTSSTATANDGFKPKVVYCEADNVNMWCEFDELVDATTGTNGVLNKSNITVENPTGTRINIQGATLSWDADGRGLLMTGLALASGQTFKVTFANVKDRDGNTIEAGASGRDNIGEGTVQAYTDGYVGGENEDQDWSSTNNWATYGMAPTRCEPKSKKSGTSTGLEVEFPNPGLALTNAQTMTVVIGAPNGASVQNVTAISASNSFWNADINGPDAGTVTISSLSKDEGSGNITVTLSYASDANSSTMRSDTQLAFELDGFRTPSTTGDKSCSIIVKNSSGVMQGSTMQGNMWTVSASGPLSIEGKVCKGTTSGGSCGAGDSGIGGVKVFLESMASYSTSGGGGSHEETTSAGDGTYSFSGLNAGEFGIGTYMDSSGTTSVACGSGFMDITLAENQSRTRASGNGVDFKCSDLSVAGAGKTLTVNITGPASTALDVWAFSPGNYQYSMPAFTTGTTNGSGALTVTLTLASDTDYELGLGPSIPKSTISGGTSASYMPTFNFLPPEPQHVKMTANQTVTINLLSADKQIKGKVVDGSGTGIPNVFVDAFADVVFGTDGSSKQTQGSFTQTTSDGSFILQVVNGLYRINACAPGLPCSNEFEVSVKDNNSNSDSNTTTDVYSDGTLLTGTGLSVKMLKSAFTISGNIKDENGSAIKNAFVNAERVSSTSTCTSFTSSGGWSGGPSDSSGIYTLYVSAGTWKVNAFSPAYGEVACSIMTVVASSLTGQTLQATSASFGTIAGTVTKNSVGLQGANVGCFGASGGNHSVTAADGTYSMKVKAGSGYTCDGFHPGSGQLTPLSNVTVTANQTSPGNLSIGQTSTITIDLGTTLTSGIYCDAKNTDRRGEGTGQNINGVYTLKVPAATYSVRCGSPSLGELFSQSGVTTTAGQTTALTKSGTTTLYTVTGRVTDGTANLEGATCTFSDKTNGRNAFFQTSGVGGSSNNFSASLPSGTYTTQCSKSGYVDTASAQSLSVSGNTSFTSRALTKASTSTTLTVQSSSANYTGDSRLIATSSDGKIVSEQVDKAVTSGANATLALTTGTWTVKAVGDNGKQSSTTTCTATASSVSCGSSTLSLDTAVTGFTAVPAENISFTPNSGGTFKDPDLGADFAVEIPANVLSTTDTSTATLQIEQNVAASFLEDTETQVIGIPVDVTPMNSSGKEMKTSESTGEVITITLPYSEVDLPAGIAEGKLMGGSWNEASGDWETLPCTVDTTNNTISCQTTHFTTFGLVGIADSASGRVSTDAVAPAKPASVTVAEESGPKVTIKWTDPSDSDLSEIWILRGENGPVIGSPQYTTVAKGKGTYTDTNVKTGSTYKYIVRAVDSNNNVTSGETEVSITVKGTVAATPTSGGTTPPSSGTTTTPATNTTTPDTTIVAAPSTGGATTTADTRAAQIDRIKAEATKVLKGADELAGAMNMKRDSTKEYAAKALIEKFDKTFAGSATAQAFVAYGTGESKALGAGERAGILASYKAAYGKAPSTESDWQDVLKIGAGRFPTMASATAETNAKTSFKKIYKRDANMSNANDSAAVTIMAYGLRPSSRNLNSESAAIKTFKSVYGKNPSSAIDWDAARALSYSGAKR